MSDTVVIVIGSVAAFVCFGTILAPVVGAGIAGRTLSRHERDLLAWSGLGVFMALFLLALLLIGVAE